MTKLVFGPASGNIPRIYVEDGRLVGRNYGQVIATLRVYFLLSVLVSFIRLYTLLLWLWAIVLLSFLLVAVRYTGVGSARLAGVVTLGIYLPNLLLAKPLDT